MADGGFRASDPVLVPQPLPYPARGVALLAPVAGILVDSALDDRPVIVKHPVLVLFDGHLRRAVPLAELLVVGRSRHTHFSGDSSDGLALPLRSRRIE